MGDPALALQHAAVLGGSNRGGMAAQWVSRLSG